MMSTKTKYLDSAALVKEIDDATVKTVLALRKRGLFPHLAVINIGDHRSLPFITLKNKKALTLGIELSIYDLSETTTKKEVLELISWLNKDEEIHGIIVQLPLTKKLLTDQTEILNAVAAAKDVDGLGRGAQVKKSARLNDLERQAAKAKRYLPTTAWAVLKLCSHYKTNLKKSLLVVGKGRLVGEPLHKILLALNLPHEYADKETADLNQKIFAAKTILTGTDTKRPFLKDRFVQEETTVISCGGEIDYTSLDGYVKQMTPKTGGVGPLTISLLLSNTARACQQQNV